MGSLGGFFAAFLIALLQALVTVDWWTLLADLW